MRQKRTVSVILLAVGLIHLSALTVAQEVDPDAQNKDITRAKDIVRRLRAGKLPSKEELDVLDNVLARLEKTSGREATIDGGTVQTTPVPDKHEFKPPPQLPLGLSTQSTKEGPVYTYVVDLDASVLRAFWLDRRGDPYGSIGRLQQSLSRDGNTLQFATNGGIFDQGHRPKGLYIDQGNIESELDTARPGANMGNFYMEPNGVFLVDSQGDARILTTQRFSEKFPRPPEEIRLAVQSGPELIVAGEINRQFTEGSPNKTRRAGVGVLNSRRVVFGISSGDISFYEFALLFARLGCRDALYLDGGPIPAVYSRAAKVAFGVDNPLVTIFGVFDKQRSH